ncbi:MULTISPECIES: replication associated protein [Lactobacillus]|uniref:Replication associated protein n=1 Tax=Lactobacillus xujianguonis TaxID=2495899 RepID=A0A437SX74_9LACO|nr:MULTISPECIES: replication associated protein [Lactobacillus]RVU71509.1 replication associated protein [Lactobacillus xujianguonis]RVU76697.1 replication associated protein [Lactobacillus xujianguonis]
MSKIIPTSRFKKQRKKVKKNPRWHNIFYGEVPFEDDHRSPWQYIIECFLNDDPIPDYFYEHPITLTKRQRQEIKNRFGSLTNLDIRGLDLHFDGHNGDHLLLYIRTNKDIIYLAGIGTHSDLF